jgi:hypothetical protein
VNSDNAPALSENTVSEKRLKANRENAKKSTGPKSKNGKRRSRQNARKHDFFSQAEVLSSRDRKVLRRLRKRLAKRLQPKGALENQCVDEIAMTKFRRARIPRWESALIRKSVQQAREEFENCCDDLDDDDALEDDNELVEHQDDSRKFTKVDVAAASMADENQIALIIRYERYFDKRLERLHAELRQLQMERKSRNEQT